MTQLRLAAIIAGLALAASVAGAKGLAPAEASEPARQLIVLQPTADAEAVCQRHGIVAGQRWSHALRGFAEAMSPMEVIALALDPDVAVIESDLPVHAAAQTTPTGIRRMGATQNLQARIDGVDERVDVDIAILDTGIDLTHPDLNVVYNKSFVRRVKTGNDDNGHGSHCAGIAAALDNTIGVVGVAPGARLWALKVLDSQGNGLISDVVTAIDFVTANAASIEVANMSLTAIGYSSSLRTAIQNSVNSGVVYVVAAGNDDIDVYGTDGIYNSGDDEIPAAYPEAMAVSALADSDGLPGGFGSSTSYGPDDTVATFSDYSASVTGSNPVTSPGAAIDVAAPGVDIFSCWKNGQYGYSSGTSMASPHVAGAVALYIVANGRAANAAGVAAIRQAIINGADPQTAWGPSNTRDPDVNKEGLVNMASGSVTVWHELEMHGAAQLAQPMANGYIAPSVNRPDRIRISFSRPANPATLVPSSFSIVGQTEGDVSSLIQSVTPETGNTAAVITLTLPLSDGERYTLSALSSLRNVSNLPYGGTLSLTVAVLTGDVDASGDVTAADLLAVRRRQGQAVTLDTARYDLDGSGNIGPGDIVVARDHTGGALP